jgi:adenylate cyclase
MQALGEALAAGLPEGMALELCEVWGAQMRFIAHAEVISYDLNLASPAIGGAKSPLEAAARLAPLTRAMLRVADLFPQPLHRRHLLQAINLATDTHLAANSQYAASLPPGETLVAVGFIDLTGYTAITQAEGDRQAMVYARRLERLVRSAAHAHDIRVVKRLGDGLMVAGASASEMLAAMLYVVGAAEQRDDIPAARAGIAYGSAVSRAGDYFGHTVNLAARILDQAEPAEVLAAEDCVNVASSGAFSFSEPRDIRLKGIREPVRIWKVESIGAR